MTTIKEDYVSFDIAKLLKEKGFDEHCFCINYPLSEGGYYNIILPNLLNNSMIPFTNEYKFCRYKEDFITIPTLQMTTKWLREVHNIDIIAPPQYDGIKWTYSAIIFKLSIPCTEIRLNDNKDKKEEACEAAIKYCLENLIK